MRFFKKRAIVAGDAADHVRINANAVIWKNRESRDMFDELHVRGAEGERQIRWKWRGDAKAARHVYHCGDANLFCEFYGWDVARAGESTPQRDGAFELFIVIARRIGLPAAYRGERQIHDRVKRCRSFFKRIRIHINFERAANLPNRLRRAVEF